MADGERGACYPAATAGPTAPAPVEEALRARERHAPRLLTGFTWVGEFMRHGLRGREVPESHWEAEEGRAVAYLRCVCGVSHAVALGAYPQKCQCPRWFFYDGTRVWSLNGPPEGN